MLADAGPKPAEAGDPATTPQPLPDPLPARRWPGLLIDRIAHEAQKPEYIAFLPALTLVAFWFGGEATLILTAIGLPVLWTLIGPVGWARPRRRGGQAASPRAQLIRRIDRLLADAAREGRTTACLVLRLDGMRELATRFGHAAHSEVLQRCADRLAGALRDRDTLRRIEGDSFAVALAPVRQADLEAMLRLGERLQACIADPISLDGTQIHVTASVGFCLAGRAPATGGSALLDAAEVAADDAGQNGPAAIRAFAPEMHRRRADRSQLRAELETALERGQILPFFQPQVATATGRISGFEALARWRHPIRGLIPPAEFLPLIEQAGLSERLGEVILARALAALSEWDAAGLEIPTVGVNFSAEQLRNPRLPELLKWELDRVDLTPSRLSVEILETVVADTDNDVIVRNIAALARMGCGIDLDDFGTGHASISNIRRFAVRRIKIDRSFVTRIDCDPAQQRMISAILSLADRLGLETLAEGVETAPERATLRQLGCGHIQGFGLARPMPGEDCPAWIADHRRREGVPPRIGRQAI